MSTENLNKFQTLVAQDPELQSRVVLAHQAAARETAEKIAALAAETGTPFSVDEFLAEANPKVDELSDEQLAAVAGGGDFENFFASILNSFALGKCDPPRDEPSGPYANYKPRRW